MDLFAKANQALVGDSDDIVVYDLDSYFQHLEDLVDYDRSFIRLPLEEEPFEIVDGGKNGRRIIKIPEDFRKNGLSVQGDESAEIIYFSIDRYYDSFDLMGPRREEIENLENPKMPVRIVIQWQTKVRKGVSLALLDKDGRPFLDDEGKLYFGWPITSEITEEAGTVQFNVRFYQFSGQRNPETNEPILSFGLSTQTASIKINQALSYDITGTMDYNQDKDLAVFAGIETILGRNEMILNRIQNSTKYNPVSGVESPEPVFIKNLPTSEEIVKVPVKEFNSETNEWEPVIQEVNGEQVPVEESYYKMDLGENGKLNLQAFAIPSEGCGIITYSGRVKYTPDGQIYKINSEETNESYDAVFVRVSDFEFDAPTTLDGESFTAEAATDYIHSHRAEGFRYYKLQDGKMVVVTDRSNIEPGDLWDEFIDYEDEAEVEVPSLEVLHVSADKLITAPNDVNKVESQANQDAVTVTFENNTIIVTADLEELNSFASTNEAQGSGKWVGIDIDTGLDTILGATFNGFALTQADIDEAASVDLGDGHIILWIKAETLPKTIVLGAEGHEDATIEIILDEE